MRRRRGCYRAGLIWMAAALWAGPPLSAQDKEPAETSSGAADDSEVETVLQELGVSLGKSEPERAFGSFKAVLESRSRLYLRDRDSAGRRDAELLLSGELETEFQLDDGLSGYLRPRFLLDALNRELFRYEPFEAYLSYGREGWDLKVGQFVENWGVVDTFNPVDILNRRDLAGDFLDPDRLGELGARLRWSLPRRGAWDQSSLSLYALPVFRRTEFAPPGGRFSLESPTGSLDQDAGFEPRGLAGGLYGLRFNGALSTRPLNADFQLLGSAGPARFPSFFIDSQRAAGGRVIPVYFGAVTAGLGFRAVPNEAVLGSFMAKLTLKAEAVYTRPYRYDGSPIPAPDDYVALVFGVDRTFASLRGSVHDLTLTVEHALEAGARDSTPVFRPFQKDLVLRALWAWNDFSRTSLETRLLYDPSNGETIGELIWQRQLREIDEDLKLGLQLQLFRPAPLQPSLFGLFPNNSLFSLSLRRDF